MHSDSGSEATWSRQQNLLSTSSLQAVLERCNPWPHVANRHYLYKPAIVIVTSLSLWRDARSPRSHYDVALIVPSFAHRNGRTSVTDIWPRLIYKDYHSKRQINFAAGRLASRITVKIEKALFLVANWHQLAGSLKKRRRWSVGR